MMIPKTVLFLLVAMLSSANVEGCDVFNPGVSGQSCEEDGQMCSWENTNGCVSPIKWQCRCNEGVYTCSCRGDIYDTKLKDSNETDVEAIDVGGVDEADSGASASAAGVASLVASGALAATIFL